MCLPFGYQFVYIFTTTRSTALRQWGCMIENGLNFGDEKPIRPFDIQNRSNFSSVAVYSEHTIWKSFMQNAHSSAASNSILIHCKMRICLCFSSKPHEIQIKQLLAYKTFINDLHIDQPKTLAQSKTFYHFQIVNNKHFRIWNWLINKAQIFDCENW